VQSDRYFHPELGYFCPGPRMQRELRVACWAGLVGVVIGAASVIALSRPDRAAMPASSAPSVATDPGTLQSRVETPHRNGEGTEAGPRVDEVGSTGAIKPRSYASQSDNGPELARVPLGRPVPLEAQGSRRGRCQPGHPSP
jgi:hypothetical protein